MIEADENNLQSTDDRSIDINLVLPKESLQAITAPDAQDNFLEPQMRGHHKRNKKENDQKNKKIKQKSQKIKLKIKNNPVNSATTPVPGTAKTQSIPTAAAQAASANNPQTPQSQLPSPLMAPSSQQQLFTTPVTINLQSSQTVPPQPAPPAAAPPPSVPPSPLAPSPPPAAPPPAPSPPPPPQAPSPPQAPPPPPLALPPPPPSSIPGMMQPHLPPPPPPIVVQPPAQSPPQAPIIVQSAPPQLPSVGNQSSPPQSPLVTMQTPMSFSKLLESGGEVRGVMSDLARVLERQQASNELTSLANTISQSMMNTLIVSGQGRMNNNPPPLLPSKPPPSPKTFDKADKENEDKSNKDIKKKLEKISMQIKAKNNQNKLSTEQVKDLAKSVAIEVVNQERKPKKHKGNDLHHLKEILDYIQEKNKKLAHSLILKSKSRKDKNKDKEDNTGDEASDNENNPGVSVSYQITRRPSYQKIVVVTPPPPKVVLEEKSQKLADTDYVVVSATTTPILQASQLIQIQDEYLQLTTPIPHTTTGSDQTTQIAQTVQPEQAITQPYTSQQSNIPGLNILLQTNSPVQNGKDEQQTSDALMQLLQNQQNNLQLQEQQGNQNFLSTVIQNILQLSENQNRLQKLSQNQQSNLRPQVQQNLPQNQNILQQLPQMQPNNNKLQGQQNNQGVSFENTPNGQGIMLTTKLLQQLLGNQQQSSQKQNQQVSLQNEKRPPQIKELLLKLLQQQNFGLRKQTTDSNQQSNLDQQNNTKIKNLLEALKQNKNYDSNYRDDGVPHTSLQNSNLLNNNNSSSARLTESLLTTIKQMLEQKKKFSGSTQKPPTVSRRKLSSVSRRSSTKQVPNSVSSLKPTHSSTKGPRTTTTHYLTTNTKNSKVTHSTVSSKLEKTSTHAHDLVTHSKKTTSFKHTATPSGSMFTPTKASVSQSVLKLKTDGMVSDELYHSFTNQPILRHFPTKASEQQYGPLLMEDLLKPSKLRHYLKTGALKEVDTFLGNLPSYKCKSSLKQKFYSALIKRILKKAFSKAAEKLQNLTDRKMPFYKHQKVTKYKKLTKLKSRKLFQKVTDKSNANKKSRSKKINKPKKKRTFGFC